MKAPPLLLIYLKCSPESKKRREWRNAPPTAARPNTLAGKSVKRSGMAAGTCAVGFIGSYHNGEGGDSTIQRNTQQSAGADALPPCDRWLGLNGW
ncbi:hypothetical protein TNCT_79991 [Trichonephila clavata]|uniref:Uncharacterized protein n=1 Tax=Trichonephila clavata TaxID=2740835 RepID=A0A8X6LA86_TRICU|nr:hypothetical protein TNCT_79991 [Trichonephila clavata]